MFNTSLDPPNSTFETDHYLQALNEEFASFISPAIVFLSTLMLLGLMGNTYVFYVYSKKNCNRTIIRFIQALAVFDLLSCAIAMPGEILDMSQNYTFGDSPLCPIFRTVNLFCTFSSGSTLVVVAADRYRRICYPLKSQIRPRVAGFILLSLSIVCMVLSLPSVVVFGSKAVPTSSHYINGSDCSISDRIADTPIPLMFNGFQLFVFMVGAIILVIIYCLIARTICVQARQRKIRGRNRRRSLKKNGGLVSPTFNRPDISSPSSPNYSNNRTVFGFPEVIKDNVLDLSDAVASEREALNYETPKDNNNTHGRLDKAEESLRKQQQHSGPRFFLVSTHGDHKNSVNLFLRSNSVSSSTSGIDTDITSNGTTSPPDTPIDVQRLECVSLIKPRLSNELFGNQSHKHCVEKLSGRQSFAKGRPNSIPENPCLERNTTTNDEIGNIANHNRDKQNSEGTSSDLKTLTLDRFERQTTMIDKKDLKSNCEETPNGFGGCSRDKITFSEQMNKDATTRKSDNNLGLSKGPRMSLILPSHDRQILFRSSSLGHEDTQNHRRQNSLKKDSKSSTSADGRNSSRRARMSSVRGLKRLTVSEYYQGTLRTTLMLFVITVIYIMSFLPHLVLMTFKAVGDESNSWEVASNIILRSYFINSVANPIIYSFCSRNFFSQCRNSPGQSGTLTR